MRIVRFLDADGNEHLGQRHPDGSTTRLKGDLFGRLVDSGEAAAVRGLLSPVRPPAVFGIGLNYARHVDEIKGRALPAHPVVFMKAPTAVIGPEAPICLPRRLPSEEVDYEGELAVVIGRPCKNAAPEDALGYVLGYTCGNDVSARDWQKQFGGGQWCRGKTFDTFCPLGPCLATAEEIPDPQDLPIRTRVNDDLRQEGHTGDMLFSVAELIAFLSGSTTLAPGTVILTGTPHGVGMGMNPPRWLQPGDTVSVEIEGIGVLVNPVEAEPV